MSTTDVEGGRLHTLYARYVGEPESKKDVYGYWLFLFGSLVGFLGIGIFMLGTQTLISNFININTISLVAYVTAAMGLPVALLGIVLLLPVKRWGIVLSVLGTLVAIAGVAWFTQVFPAHWPPVKEGVTNKAPKVVAVYASGVGLIALVTILVPVFTGEKSMFFEKEYERTKEYPPVAVGEAVEGGMFSVFRQGEEWQWRFVDQEALAGSVENWVSKMETQESADIIREKVQEARLLEINHAAFRLYEAAEEAWEWELMSENGSIVAESDQEFTSRDQAGTAVNKLKELGPDADVVDISGGGAFEYRAEGDQMRWRLVDDDRNVLAEGPTVYDSRGEAREAMDQAQVAAENGRTLSIESIGIELFQDGGAWRWRLLDGADQELARSEGTFDDRRAVEETVYDLLEDVAAAPVLDTNEPAYEVDPADGDGWEFRLIDETESVVARSAEDLPDHGSAEQRAELMSDHAGSADIVSIENADFEYYPTQDGWRWRLVTEDREVLAESIDAYSTPGGAAESIEQVQTQANKADLIEFENAAFQEYEHEGEWDWRLIDEDGNVMASSAEDHEDRESARDSMMAIKEQAPDAEMLEIDTSAFELFQDEADDWNWRLVDISGEELARGAEMLPTREGAKEAIDRLKDATTDSDSRQMDAPVFQAYADENNKWGWKFVTSDGDVLAESEDVYGTRDEAVTAIQSDVKGSFAGASVYTIESLALKVDARGERYSWEVEDARRKTLATSTRSHIDREDTQEEIDLFQQHADEATVFELDEPTFQLRSTQEGWEWRLADQERNTLMVGPGRYDDVDTAQAAIDDVQANVEDAEVLDYDGAAFELLEAEDDAWKWQLIDEDGRVMATSAQNYSTRDAATQALDALREELEEASILEIETAAFEIQEDDGRWSWRLIDANGNPIANSVQTYESRSAALESKETLQEHAPDATISVAE